MEWISVEDELPDSETTVICNLHRDGMDKVEQVYYESPYWFFDFPSGLSDAEKFGFSVTHWVPLPEPPS